MPPNHEAMAAIDVINAVGALGEDRASAIDLYKSWLQSHPQDPHAYAIAFNLGVLHKDQGDEVAAEAAYRRAIELNPACMEAQFNLGSQLERLNRPQEAVVQWQDMLIPGRLVLPRDSRLYQMTLNNLGRLLENLRSYGHAEQMLLRSLTENPAQPDVLHHFYYLRQKQCEWPVYMDLPGVPSESKLMAAGPMSVLAGSDEPALHLKRMQAYAQEKIPTPPVVLSDGTPYAHPRLRVGYLSSDFCLHAVSMLTVELFELHDRSKVEVYGFCWSRDDGSALRQRVVRAFDHYVPIGEMSDEAAARLIHSLEIDVLVDLHGLTLGARPGILGWHPAPVQVTYLGFPGTTGIPGVDYVLADRFVLPEETAQYFTEKPLYLPHCYQVSDRQRVVGPAPTRASCGLPDDAVVFCSFNNNYKFTPEIFAVWMRILQRVPGSVLWLLADNSWSEENLRRQAEAAGIARERIIFAGRIAPAEYHARYQVADLFLDNRPYGAGTTANDALWAGLPLLTCPGKTFASRMAGSLLHAMNLPELIAASLEDYEERAVTLGNDRQRMASLRQKVVANKVSSALFDLPLLVRDIEQAFFEVCRFTGTSLAGLPAPAPAMPDPVASVSEVARGRTSPMRIATLIPAYKTQYIPQLLRALSTQTVKPDVVIVSDDSPGGIFRQTLYSPLYSEMVAKLHVEVHEGPRKKSAFENFKHLITLEGGRFDLAHVLLDDDVIYPDFYERHRMAHHSGDFSCSISARWTAAEDGQPYDDLPIPEFVRAHPNRLLSLDAGLAFLTTVGDARNWFGEFSNVVFRTDCLPMLLDSRLAGVSYAGLWDLGGFLHVGTARPICYLQEHLGYFRRGANDQNSAKPAYVKSALVAYAALGLAAKRAGILSHAQVADCFGRVAAILPVLQAGEEALAAMIAVMPGVIQGSEEADEQFLSLWNRFLDKHGF